MTMNIKYWSLVFVLLLCLPSCKEGGGEEPTPVQQIQAFPGAEGGGRFTSGGRGGMVLHVTSLSDEVDKISGQPAFGTLRKALQTEGTRTIVFDVSGTINLRTQLDIVGGNVTIAGQTAPGDGICIAGYPVVVKTDNVIIRFLRFRMGDQNKVEGDAFTAIGHKNILVDHCSFSWSTDECVSVYGNENFTLQYCFITESLRTSVHDKGSHGYGGIWGGKLASFHHNMICHVNNRSPRFNGARYNWTGYTSNERYSEYQWENAVQAEIVDFRNCVIYNCGNGCYGGPGGGYINMVNNYYKTGPAGSTSRVTSVSIANTIIPKI